MDSNFLKYLSTAPVLCTVWLSFTAGFVIEANRFFPAIPEVENDAKQTSLDAIPERSHTSDMYISMYVNSPSPPIAEAQLCDAGREAPTTLFDG